MRRLGLEAAIAGLTLRWLGKRCLLQVACCMAGTSVAEIERCARLHAVEVPA
jgi:hypothetical protein